MRWILLAGVLVGQWRATSSCTLDSQCSHGTCSCHDSTCHGTCRCEKGFSGDDCSHDPCSGANCHHGSCNRNSNGKGHTCSCNTGFSGGDCSHDPCSGANCHHGSCNRNSDGKGHTCSCTSGWINPGPCNTRQPCNPMSAPANSEWEGGGEQCEKRFQESCHAKCKSGWTGGTDQATFTCKADKTYSGSLNCEKVACELPQPPLPTAVLPDGYPGGGCVNGKCPPNTDVDTGSCKGVHFSDACTITCEDGFTRSTPEGATSQSYTCRADGRKKVGKWDPDPTNALRCDAVQCYGQPREDNTFDPLLNFAARGLIGFDPVNDVHQLDKSQLGALPGDRSICSAHYLGIGDITGVETATNGTCMSECLPSWYPAEGRNRQRSLSCFSRGPSGGPTGDFAPTPGTPNVPLNCTPGVLAVNKTSFVLEDDASSSALLGEHAKQWPFLLGDLDNRFGELHSGDRCQGWKGAKILGGCFDGFQFAAKGEGYYGPTINFYVQAMDEHSLPRNYQTLPCVGERAAAADYLVAVIERVPLERLNAANPASAALQPRVIDEGDCCTDTAEGRDCLECPLRQYRSTIVAIASEGSSDSNGVVTNPGKPPGKSGKQVPQLVGRQKTFITSGADGLWRIKHQFSEHGVFFISIYLCQNDGDAKIPRGCQPVEGGKPAPSLVPGTGLTLPNNGSEIATSELPRSTFTVCPQNTEPRDQYDPNSGIFLGAHLEDCRAKVGYYSPKGPGYIAEKCQDGFVCAHAGQRWPVAKPDFWVDPSEPSKMSKCGFLGACPGSSIFVDDSSCPTNNHTEFNLSKIDFELKTLVLSYGCFMYGSGKGVDAHEPSTHGHSGRPKPVLEKKCYAEAGSRCCLGYTGKKCAECCRAGEYGDRFPSCNKKQWHSLGSGEGQHCEQCPDSNMSPALVVLLLFMGLMLLPLIVKTSEVLKHAGAATGPMLSLVNFVQSADLFQALDLHWPQRFKDFCRQVASYFNSLNLGTLMMKWLNSMGIGTIPTPQCQLQLTFLQKWTLIMASPLMAIALYYTLIILHILFWRSLALELVWKTVKLHSKHIWRRSCERCRCGANCRRRPTPLEQQERLMDQMGQSRPEPEPEPEPGPVLTTSYILDSAQSGKSGESAPVDGHGWQYRALERDGHGQWQDFDLQDQQHLTDADRDGVQKTVLQRGEFQYEINLKTLVQVNMTTKRQRNIRRPARGFFYRNRFTRSFLEHSWESTLSGAIRFVLLYLLVGYTFLSGTAVEPIACQQDIDQSKWIEAAPSIECNWCSMDPIPDDRIPMTYRTLASLSVVAFTLYGFGTPMLFGIIMWSHKDVLQSNRFVKNFGFLVTKMKTEYFWWEILISLRKLALVIATKFADGQRLPCALVNMFVTITAFGTQVWVLPFANTDANVAEALTLLATILILVLGLAQKTQKAEEMSGDISEDEDALAGTFLYNLNIVIYLLMGGMVFASIVIVLRRLRGALFNAQHLAKLDNAENDGRQIPDEVRKRLHKKWLLVASSWAAIKAEESREDSELNQDDVVRLTSGDLAHVKQVRPGGREGKYVVELAKRTSHEDIDTECCGLDAQMGYIQDKIRKRRMVETTEQRELSRENLMKEGDIERMTRVFTTFAEQQESKLVSEWEGLFPHWDDFFPETDRRAMYILGATAKLDDLEDLVWVMQQLIAMEEEQHTFTPKCCRKVQEAGDVLRSHVMAMKDDESSGLEQEQQSGAQSDGLSLAQRRSNLRTTMENLRKQQENQSVSCYKSSSCKAIARFLQDDGGKNRLWGTQRRAVTLAVVTLVSVGVTVYCVTRVLVPKWAGTGDDSSADACMADDGGAFVWALVVYWFSLLTIVSLSVLYCKRQVRMEGTQFPDGETNPARQSANRPLPGGTSGYGHRNGSSALSMRTNDRQLPSTGWHTSESTAGASASRPASDDEYDSGGEDNPGWQARLDGAE